MDLSQGWVFANHLGPIKHKFICDWAKQNKQNKQTIRRYFQEIESLKNSAELTEK